MATKKEIDAGKVTDEQKALSIAMFCYLYEIGKTLYYRLKAMGKGPPEILIGGAIRILVEDANDWDRERKAELANDTEGRAFRVARAKKAAAARKTAQQKKRPGVSRGVER
jgi:hypothetical protein